MAKSNAMREFVNIVAHRGPSVQTVIGFIAGLALPVKRSADDEEQAKNYNGFSGDTTVNNFAFSPLCKIMFACYNCPGS
jgi:hypothetical protein